MAASHVIVPTQIWNRWHEKPFSRNSGAKIGALLLRILGYGSHRFDGWF